MILDILKYLAILCFGIFAFTFILLVRNVRFPRYAIVVTPDHFGMPYKKVSFYATDGTQLSGWLVIQNKERPVVLVCHGLGTNKSDVLDIANSIYKAGYNLFLFDFRGHGDSRGNITSYGYLEQRDIKGALDYLDGITDIPHNGYGIFGPSMGGACGLLVAAQDKRIKALVVDSIYADLKDSIIRHVKLLYNLPKIPFGYLTIAEYDILFMIDINNVSPIKVIKNISPRAVFIINGEDDERMLATDASKLHQTAGEPRQLWIVPRATHFESFWIAQEEYRQKVTDFFYKYLPLQ